MFGIKQEKRKEEIYKVIIMGSGPAGLTAALYSSRANLSPLVISGREPGGQLTITSDVDNYPGFPDGILGPDLIGVMRKQAERFGTEFIEKEVTKVDLNSRPFKIFVDGSLFLAESLIVASGATAKLLGIEAEKRLMGRGVSACATCDGFFFRGKEVVVAGGGDTAIEEAIFLTRFASKITIVHRRDKLRASKIMQDKAMKNEKIGFIWDSVVEDIVGDKETGVSGVKLRNVKTNEVSIKDCQGIFVAIGHKPNTELFQGILELDKGGYIATHDGTKTSIPGVFAAGDVQDHIYRQAVTAAGSGCMAAIDAERFLENS
ncbi:MAG: thioredoxin-disulfide reductase [Candidatus Schekmanbacteria bacterium RBG_16_38_10]|uniref:Thioredoxin reductase n=1 Tax=Candidatus Schekmanbacteria bacterium RBG_16_38_10 TaxID=1817879 RepID=A0A1F7RTE8_9BACT|nr:MAG: thioredoxin-disulfide reductase [Candidatus Schekmanbacteria bacterium RBG_16_38_10]